MAIEILKTPIGEPDAGMFNLPPNFDRTKYAAEWALESQVAFKQQRQSIPGHALSADGWSVWKNDRLDGPTTVIGSGNKKFVLMCRDRKVQEQFNALCGNTSKKAINREVTGETVAGEPQQDAGMLPESRLRGNTRGENSGVEESVLPLNEAPVVAAT